MLDSATALRLHRLVRESPNLTAGKQADRAGRAARLSAALRDNLRRRKEQARAQAASREAQGGASPPRDTPGTPALGGRPSGGAG